MVEMQSYLNEFRQRFHSFGHTTVSPYNPAFAYDHPAAAGAPAAVLPQPSMTSQPGGGHASAASVASTALVYPQQAQQPQQQQHQQHSHFLPIHPEDNPTVLPQLKKHLPPDLVMTSSRIHSPAVGEHHDDRLEQVEQHVATAAAAAEDLEQFDVTHLYNAAAAAAAPGSAHPYAHIKRVQSLKDRKRPATAAGTAAPPVVAGTPFSYSSNDGTPAVSPKTQRKMSLVGQQGAALVTVPAVGGVPVNPYATWHQGMAGHQALANTGAAMARDPFPVQYMTSQPNFQHYPIISQQHYQQHPAQYYQPKSSHSAVSVPPGGLPGPIPGAVGLPGAAVPAAAMPAVVHQQQLPAAAVAAQPAAAMAPPVVAAAAASALSSSMHGAAVPVPVNYHAAPPSAPLQQLFAAPPQAANSTNVLTPMPSSQPN